MLYIMAVRVHPFIFKLMLTSYAAHVTLMAVLQTQNCPEGTFIMMAYGHLGLSADGSN